MLSESIPDRFGYCGEFLDSESGLVYLRARYYDSKNGRFLSEDRHWNIYNMIYGDEPYKRFVNYPLATKTNQNNVAEKLILNNVNTNVDSHPDSILDGKKNAYKKIECVDVETTAVLNTVDIKSLIQSSNLYAYVMNNPVSYCDKTGEVAGVDDAAIAIVAGVVVLVGGVILYSEHNKNKRESNRNKHEQGQKRKQTDTFGGEKGDARRTSRKDKRK